MGLGGSTEDIALLARFRYVNAGIGITSAVGRLVKLLLFKSRILRTMVRENVMKDMVSTHTSVHAADVCVSVK